MSCHLGELNTPDDVASHANAALPSPQELGERVGREDAVFHLFADMSTDAMWLSSWPTPALLYVNPAFERLWGIPVGDLTVEQWMESIDVADRDRVREAFFHNCPREGMDIVYRIRSRDGTARWIHDRGFPIRDDKGQVYRLGGVARDITELHQQSECLQEFLKVSRDLFVACRLDGTRILVSPSVQDILGVSPEEYLRGTFRDYIHPDDMPMALETAERVRQGHTVLDQQVRYRHKDGSYR